MYLYCRQEVLLLDNEISFNEAIIEEREQGIQEVQQQIGEVNEIFKDLAVLVHEQGTMIGKSLSFFITFRYQGEHILMFAIVSQMILVPTLRTLMLQLHKGEHNLLKLQRPKDQIHLW